MTTAEAPGIRALVASWAAWRDAGEREGFATCRHPEGRMMAASKRGSAGRARGVSARHLLGGRSSRVAGHRADEGDDRPAR